jgi:hypothetical protein
MARSRGVAVLAFVLLPLSAPAQTVIIGGGGNSRTDCLVVLDVAVNYPPDKPKRFRCTDGDACDADATVNGVCAFDVGVCANSDYNPTRCSLVGVDSIIVDHAIDNGEDPKFDPEFLALQNRINNGIVGPGDPPNEDPNVCALPSRFLVPVLGPFEGNVCKRGKKQVKITSFSTPILGRVFKDRDKLQMECLPALAGCTPMVFFTGTFDRIQRQIFDQTCAVSACHDSESQTGDLILEAGSSYTSLVDHAPDHPGAIAAGWLRVDGANADAENSFLYHKITGDLDAQGARMPLVGGKLDDHLIEIIRLWIEDGAPATGWVAGTF